MFSVPCSQYSFHVIIVLNFLQSLHCLILKRSSKIHKSLSSNSQIPQVSRLSVGQVFPFSQEIKSMVIYNMLIHIICLVSPILALITPESLLHLLCSPSIVNNNFHVTGIITRKDLMGFSIEEKLLDNKLFS